MNTFSKLVAATMGRCSIASSPIFRKLGFQIITTSLKHLLKQFTGGIYLDIRSPGKGWSHATSNIAFARTGCYTILVLSFPNA